MKSDFENFLSAVFQLLGELRQQMGALAWIALGGFLILGIVFCILALRWVRQGGSTSGCSHRFFAEHRGMEGWLKRR